MTPRIVLALLTGALLTACVPVPTVTPKPSIAKLDRTIPRLANGDTSVQYELANGFSFYGGEGLGKDQQTSDRYIYAAADHGDARAQRQFAHSRYSPDAAKDPELLMDEAFWLYGLAIHGDSNSAYELGRLYARPEFPLSDRIESCKWTLVAKYKCNTKNYSEADIAEAAKRAQPVIKNLPPKPFNPSVPILP